MQIVDANVLVYAVNDDAPQHKGAKRWLDEALNGAEAVGFTWPVLLAFLRLATSSAIFPTPLTLDDAVSAIEDWLARPAAVVVHPTGRHLSILHGLLTPVGTAVNLVNDAHLATVALEHGGGVASYDRDFARFTGVRWMAPPGAG